MDETMTLLLTGLIAVIAVAAVTYMVVRSQQRKNETMKSDATPLKSRGEAVRDAAANPAFVRRLKRAAWKRGLAVITPNAEKSPFVAILVGPSGVTGVLGADYSGTVYGSAEAEWAQVTNGVRHPFENPILQAETARKSLRELLNEGKFRSFTVGAKAVLTCPKAELVIPRNVEVFTVKDFLRSVELDASWMEKRRVDEAAVEKFLREKLEKA